MADSFVPLIPGKASALKPPSAPASGSSPSAPPRIFSGETETSTPAFVPATRVLGRKEEAAVPPPPCNADPLAQPKVILHREGDRVARIQVICTCGQVIDLDCTY